MPTSLDPAALQPLRHRLAEHPVYRAAAASVDGLRRFTEHHVFAVWDFMSLLKSLQRELTCVDVPWTPVANREGARMIHEIVLGEESDQLPDGRTLSHFELYLGAMHELGANTAPIDTFVAAIAGGDELHDAFARADIAPAVRAFVQSTLEVALNQPLHARAAAFLVGRENLIPAMFREMLRALADRGATCKELLLYLQRHVELDGGAHGELAERLLQSLCGDDDAKWSEASRAAEETLRARLHLWDAVHAAIAEVAILTSDPTP